MAKPIQIKNKHYLGVIIEKALWNKLRQKAASTQDSVGKLVRNALIDLVESESTK